MPGEDAPAYEALLIRVSADVKPADIIEKIWVRDFVDLSWEILRLRRIKMGLASRRKATELSDQLDGNVHEHPNYQPAEGMNIQEYSNSVCYTLAHDWVRKDPDVVAWVNELEANRDISLNEVLTSAFISELHTIERIDRLLAVAESRRNSVLREIERRRATFGRSLRDEIQKVEEAEFEIVGENRGAAANQRQLSKDKAA